MKSDGTRLARPTFSVHYDKDLILDAPRTKCREGIPDMELRWNAEEIRDGLGTGHQGRHRRSLRQ